MTSARCLLFRGALVGMLGLITVPLAAPAHADERTDFMRQVLHDPDAPVSGNPDGDVTIVEYADYNCPVCRRTTPELEAFLATDPGVRVVHKDWPILAESSVLEAQVALAANYQGKYMAAHDALMRIAIRPATKEGVKQAVQAVGIDVARLNGDLASHSDAIAALLKRNLAQADAMELKGTPVFLIGPFMKAQGLDAAGFRQVVADARVRQHGAKTGE